MTQGPELLLVGELASATTRALVRRNTTVDYQHYELITNQQYHLATAFLFITPVFQALAILVVAARVYTRALPTWRFGKDDYLVTLAFVLTTVMWALQYDSTTWAWHSRPTYRNVHSVSHSVKSGTLALPFWACGTGLTKISIAFTLLKFQQSRRWTYFVYSIVGLNIVFISFVGIAYITRCIPYAANWDLTGKYDSVKKCWSDDATLATIYMTIICHVTSDVTLSLAPLTFLKKVRRPFREKVVIGSLMALGIIASAFSIARVVVQLDPRLLEDPTSQTIFTGIMTSLEAQCSIIAACIPMLRSSTNRWLRKLGIWGSSSPPSPQTSAQYYPEGLDRHVGHASGHSKQSRRVLELNEVERQDSSHEPEWTLHADTESTLDSGRYVMDPNTGRIIRVEPGSMEWNSMSNLHDEWLRDAV